LNPSGFLLLGNAESAASYPQMFTPLNKKSKIYSKKIGNHRQQRMFKTSRTSIQATASPVVKRSPSAVPAGMNWSCSNLQIESY